MLSVGNGSGRAFGHVRGGRRTRHAKIIGCLFGGVLLMMAPRARAQEVGFIERYALAENREQVLAELIPGTADYYYYHCLHFQVMQRLSDAQAMLDRWQAHQGPNGDGRLRGILQRQMLLSYGDNPQRTLDFIRNELGLNLDHAPPVAPGERRLPSQLDQSLIDPDRALDEAVNNNWATTPAGKRRLAAKILGGAKYPPEVLTNLLHAISEPGIDRLDELVIAELRQRPEQERSFGDRAAHNGLTRKQLDAVRSAFPALGPTEAFVNRYLRCLRPSDDTDMTQQPDVWRRYLEALDAYVDTLPPAYNSLKACVLYQRLQADRVAGQMDLQRFLRYLRLPRNGGLVAPVYLQRMSQQPVALLEADFTQQCLCPPIRYEDELVRAYLEEFLRSGNDTRPFEGLLVPEYLRQVFAETKLLAGVGNADQWFAMLDPTARRTLQDRVEVTLTPTNPPFHSADQPTSLELDLKNVEQLTIRIYQINAESYYRAGRPPLSSAIDLDGLQANIERTLTYSYPAVRRHRERIELPELTGRGIWVVDFLGGGQRSRAFIRRGDLRWSISSEPRGHAIQVVDERQQPIPGARLWLGTQEFSSDDAGVIAIPYAAEPASRTAVLSDGALATQVNFTHEAEQYALQAAFHVHRQQLRSGQPADLVIRPRLLANSRPAALEILKNVQLIVVATDQEGSSTTKRYEDLKLDDADAIVQTVRIPPRLANLQVTLTAQVEQATSGSLLSLSTSNAWTCNEIDRGDQIVDFFLTRDQQDWVIEAIGRNGEPIRNLIVTLTFAMAYRDEPIRTNLQSDDNGQVRLGPMRGVVGVSVEGAGSAARSWPLLRDQAPWPPLIHAVVGQSIYLPVGLLDDSDQSRWRLWDLRQDVAVDDVRKAISIDAGRVKIASLAAGDYELQDLAEPRRTRIRVTTGPVVEPWVYGPVRQLQREGREPLGIAGVRSVDGQLVIELAGAGPMTRIHVFGSRYLPPQQPGESLGLNGGPLAAMRHGLPRSFYQSDRRLAEEYQYVLRRRQSQQFPGNLLPQPSLILNPWQTDVTENVLQQVADGEALAEQMAPPASAADMPAISAGANRGEAGNTASLEFLSDDGLVLLNLKPNAEGRLLVPAKLLEGVALLQVVACDPLTWIQQSISQPLSPLKPRDRRLIQSLDPQQNYARRQAVLVGSPDHPIDLGALASARVRLYTSVNDLYTLYGTLLSDPRWSEFSPLARWHSLSSEQKQESYGRLASHELHTFLKYKDPEFFAQVVKPYLANKAYPSLVDRWLLDLPISNPALWSYDRNNAFERALFGRLLVAERDRIVREFQERLADRKEDQTLLRKRLDAALLGDFLSDDAAGRAVEYFGNMPGGDPTTLGIAAASEAAGFGGSAMPMGGGGMGGLPARPAEPTGSNGEFDALRRLAERGAARDEAKDKRAFAKQFSDEKAEEARLWAAEDRAGYGNNGRGRMALGRSLALSAMMYRPLEATKQWAESYYDHVRRSDETADLIPLNPFWFDFLQHDGSKPFASQHSLLPVSGRAEALIALSVIGLPLTSTLELPGEQEQGPWRPAHPVLIVSEQLQQLPALEGQPPVLVGQRFEPLAGDPTAQAAAAPIEFLTGQGYRGLVVLTNPSPQPRQVNVLWQIPAGSLPLAAGRATDNRVIELPAFATERVEFHFYFPEAGKFSHYPACVSQDDKVIAKGEAMSFVVVDQPTQVDELSWRHVAEKGSAAEITTFLAKNNLRKLDWSLVLHRLSDRAVYDAVLNALDTNDLWVPEAWAYSVRHNDPLRLTQFMNHQDHFVNHCGPVFQSQLLTIEPIERVLYEHLEYSPLVVARAHPLRERTEITNDRLLNQYQRFMNVLAYQPMPTKDQQLALCYYFVLQQRIGEALSRFDSVARDATQLQLQYDYLDAFLAMYRMDYDRAGAVAGQYEQHPVPRWRERFAEVRRQLAQRAALLAGGTAATTTETGTAGVPTDAADLSVLDRDRVQADRAALQPAARLTFEGSTLVIDHTRLPSAKVQLYRMDLELLFSFTPFVKQDLGQLAMIAPNRTESLPISGPNGKTRWPLPEDLAGQALLVEVVGQGLRETALYYGSQITTYVAEPFGQLQVLTAADRKPVVGAYVKVYARHADGSERFYKDGYTDLRGRFDYASLSTGDADTVQRFAILVLGTEGGATLHEVDPPPR